MEDSALRALHKGVKTTIPYEKWLELRDRCRKDLWWLFSKVLRRSLAEQPQKSFCESYPVLDFDGVYREGYTLDDVHQAIARQAGEHQHGILAARSSTKSTVNCVRNVQWLLNCPDIRIAIMCATRGLAAAFMRETKSYFFLAEDAEPTDFHKLFPEYVIREDTEAPLTVPCRRYTVQKEASLWVTSIDSRTVGWRCDVFVADDVIDDDNSQTDELRQKVHDRLSNALNLLDDWGFLQVIGTRYDPDDEYRLLMDTGVKFAIFPAWTPKPGKETLPLRDLKESDVDLLFPSKITYESLRKKLLRNEKSFRGQQLQDPPVGMSVTFDEDALHAHILGASACPRAGKTFIAWDWAAKGNRGSDLSAGAVGRVSEDGKQLFVMEVVYDHFRPSELPIQMVKLAMKWHPDGVVIEDANGSEFLKLEIMRVQQKMGFAMPMRWLPVDTQLNAKANRIKSLEILLSDDRLWFASGNWIEETFQQFTRYTGLTKNRGRRDDIPDAISMLAKFVKLREEAKPEAENHDGMVQVMPGVWVPRPGAQAPDPAEASRYFGTPQQQAMAASEHMRRVNPNTETVSEGQGDSLSLLARYGLDF